MTDTKNKQEHFSWTLIVIFAAELWHKYVTFFFLSQPLSAYLHAPWHALYMFHNPIQHVALSTYNKKGNFSQTHF